MRMNTRLAFPIVGPLCLACVLQPSAFAKWHPQPLPGTDKHVGLEVALVGGISIPVIAMLIHHHHHHNLKDNPGTVAIPSDLNFDRDTERKLTIVNNSPSSVTITDLMVVDRGFSILGAVSFPKLLRGRENFEVSISRSAPFNAKRGRLSVGIIDSKGKRINRMVALHATTFGSAQ